jgi:hypothetical protein
MDDEVVTALKSAALSRHVLDVWLEYRFNVFAVGGKFNIGHPEFSDIPIASEDDPYSAILAAGEWMKEHAMSSTEAFSDG